MKQSHVKGSVRHAEKRRTSTCEFADRVARSSIQAFRTHVPQEWREENKQTCIAAIVAHFPPLHHKGNDASDNVDPAECGHLQVVGLGVGTKFLSEKILQEEEATQSSDVSKNEESTNFMRETAVQMEIISDNSINDEVDSVYGKRVRDSHAEVLARRAFRRQITLEMIELMEESVGSNSGHRKRDFSATPSSYRPLLKISQSPNVSFSLVAGVTLHFYSSSAPCGNATLKKFATMRKEKFQADYGPDQWPNPVHEHIQAHSIRLGQFTLLVKKDRTINAKPPPDTCIPIVAENTNQENKRPPKKRKTWPANETDEWCPPGTTIVPLRKGSIHTCSDKICRWNCFGMQGSLLASVIDGPLYMSTLTVGRKFTSCICQRAVCCRIGKQDFDNQKVFGSVDNEVSTSSQGNLRLNHPAIMGTGVYLDESGILDMSGSKTIGQDVRFISNQCWIWWPHLCFEDASHTMNAECIDGELGFPIKNQPQSKETEKGAYSKVSTFALTSLFLKLTQDLLKIGSKYDQKNPIISLSDLQSLKCDFSHQHEMAKNHFFKHDNTFRQWKRRGKIGDRKDEQ